jgi:hypothetical protein
VSRIRTIKPEMWASDDFHALSTEGQLLFIYLISNADDDGRLKTSPENLARLVGRDIDSDSVATQIAVMGRRGMAMFYRIAGATYIALTNFRAHQKIDKPRDSSLPPPPLRATNRRTVADDAAISREESSNGRDPRAGARAQIDPLLDPDLDPNEGNAVLLVYQQWVGTLPEGARRELTEGRRRLIRAALNRWPTADVLDAVKGWRWDEWQRRPHVNDIEDCLRPANIERFRDWERGINRPAKKGLAPVPEDAQRRADQDAWLRQGEIHEEVMA